MTIQMLNWIQAYLSKLQKIGTSALQNPYAMSAIVQSCLFRLTKLGFLARKNPNLASTIKRVKRQHLTYLEICALTELAYTAAANEQNGIEGVIIETGCALGGSAIVLASAKTSARPLYIYDVFGMIPPPSAKDGQDVCKRYTIINSGQSLGIGRKRYYGYEENLYEKVIINFKEFGIDLGANNVHLVKGLFEDALLVKNSVALAHIDCDWYKSVMTCLQRIEPYLVRGGTLVIDDYYYWSGCKKAVDDYFFSKDKDKYVFRTKSRLHIIKK